jgi:hypothetical protein
MDIVGTAYALRSMFFCIVVLYVILDIAEIACRLFGSALDMMYVVAVPMKKKRTVHIVNAALNAVNVTRTHVQIMHFLKMKSVMYINMYRKVFGIKREIIYATTLEEIEVACARLQEDLKSTTGVRILAFDTERDMRHPHDIRVLSMATRRMCVVISFSDANAPRDTDGRRIMPPCAYDLLCHGGAIRVGISLDQEQECFDRDFDSVYVKNILDLQLCDRLKRASGGTRSLKTLVSEYLGIEMSKETQTSNWTRIPLSRKQIMYSALDSIYCVDLSLAMFAPDKK